MSKLTWDNEGERLFETGVSEVALYPFQTNGYTKGVAWNGVSSITDSPGGAESNKIYADNIEYLNLMSAETAGGTIEAYMAPAEFAECDGSVEIAPGVYAGQQNRKKFGLAYKTTRMSEVGEAADGMRSGVEIAIGAMGKALENSKFLQALQVLWNGVKTIGNGITKAMKTLASGFVEDINNVNFSSVFDVLSGISLAGIAVGINKFLKGITDAVSDVTKLTDQIKGILDSVRGCFEAYQTQLKAGTLIKIASAIAILTGAIVVLSLIDSAKLASAITAMTGLFAELMASMAIFTKISGDLKKAGKTTTIMLGLSVSVLILASALKKIASLSWNEIAKGLTGITVISGVLAGVTKVISKDEKIITKGAFNLIFLATAVKILASACKDISKLSWGELCKGLTGVGVLMAEIALFLNTAKFSGKAVSTATGILVLSAAIKVLASACKDFGSMQWSEIGKGLTSIGILLAEIAAFTNLTGNTKHVVSTGVALIAISSAMKIMASAVGDFGSMQWDEIGKGLTAMAEYKINN